ncbi:hypothetical protein M758_2G012000 [Ceratodon purpureus]|nr:hypothetical protein M758_2G012000 [Ceratodon purpureus]
MGAAVEPELPSFYELVHRFSLFDSSASSGCDVQIGANGSVFCKCEGCVRWHDFVEGRDPSDAEVKYEVFTREHVTGLACYLRSRFCGSAKAADYELPVMDVLEVGAGSGRLAQHLNRSLTRLLHENQGPVVRVTATDSGARGINGPEVKEEDAVHAMTSRKAHIIISSWMPRGIDWTAHMRAAPSVREYILIGETDNGICGCPWETWGYSPAWDWSESDDSDSSSSDNNGVLAPNSVITDSKISVTALPTEDSTQGSEVASCGRATREKPPYEEDGWERVELGSLSSLQLCRTDERWSSSRHSHTVAFRKK